MRTRIMISAVLTAVILSSAVTFGHGLPTRKAAINKDIIATNLLEGIKSENQGLKTGSAYMLGEINTDLGVIPLMSLLKSSDNENTRIVAALSLYKIGDSRGIFAIKQAIKFDQSQRVRRMCSIFYQAFAANHS